MRRVGVKHRAVDQTMADRLLASRLGAAAVTGLIEGKHGCVVGLVKSDITFTPYVEVVTQRKTIDQDLFRLLKMLAV